jgi:glycosyltransferase involved in cell wall biosynthesis
MLAPWFKHTYPLKHAKKWLYWPWGEYQVLRDASAVIFASEQEKLDARRSFWLYRVNELVVPFGAPASVAKPGIGRSAFLGRFPELAQARIVLFLGRIHPIKGCDVLIRAFASAMGNDPSWRLVIAGPDQAGLKPSLVRLASEAGIAHRVTWTGMLDDDMKEGAFHSAEVFVLPSHHESFGLVVAEALSRGLPVLISDKVTIWREVVADGAGFAASDDADSIAELLRSWTALSKDDRKAMSDRACNCFVKRFEIKKAALDFQRSIGMLIHD